MKFLVIDDIQMVRFCLGKLLDVICPDCEIVEACDERQGVELIENNPPFDMVVTDLDTPAENGGLLVIKAAKRHCEDTPVLLVTGGRSDEDLERLAQSVGANACLGKPFDLDKLRAVVSRALAKAHQAA